jgi:cytochrome P450
MSGPRSLLFNFSLVWYITPYERDILANCRAIRSVFNDFVEKRQKDQSGQDYNDILSILLADTLFCKDKEKIVDELLTVFFAGNNTSSNANQNLIMQFI